MAGQSQVPLQCDWLVVHLFDLFFCSYQLLARESPLRTALIPLTTSMASQDYISQFSQGIPATQPDRSPSRTPRRELPSSQDTFGAPSFHGPLHQAYQALHVQRTQQRPWLTYLSQSHGWRNPNAPAMTSMPQSWSWAPTPSPLLPTRRLSTSTSTSTSRTLNASAVLNDISKILHLRHSTFGLQDQSRLSSQALRNASYDELETGRRLPRHPEGEWPRLPVHYSLQQIQPVQGHRGDGPFITSTPVEVPLSRIEQQLAPTRCLRPALQHIQSWLPTATAPDPTGQQRILDLEAEIAELKAPQGDDTAPSGSTPSASTPTAPIVQSLQGRSPSSPNFDPSICWLCQARQTLG